MDAAEILTPDQRVRVFVSSTLNELADERVAARHAIERLYLTPVMFELGARPYPPRSLYLAYLRQSHVFVGIYGDQYGWTAPGMDASGLEDELRHATGLPLLLYLRAPAPGRDPRLTALLDDVASTSGASYKTFGATDELESLLAADLALLLTERFTSQAAPASNIAVPTPASEFVGRWAELGELVDLLTSEGVRLVTLTGPGGIGKTRLAIQAAHAVADRFSDGVVFVSLAARGPEDFLEAVATAVGLKDLGQQPLADLLTEHLRDRHELLVLDNFEQLLASAGTVVHLLEQTSSLRLLVTSRTALRLSGEEEFPVPPLSVPRVTSRVEDVTRADATQLFCRRVAAVRHGYRLTEHDAATVARICRRLDGLPLALELVAARANVMSIEELAARLDRVLDLSARSPDVPARQRTLRQTMDWSYGQLPQPARDVFARLGLFVGPFPLRAAEAVCRSPSGTDLLDALAVLVDHSLLQPHLDAGEARFSMLEIVREYARSLMDETTYDATAERHAAYYSGVAMAAFTDLRGTTQWETVSALDADADDIGAALDWLIARGRRSDVADVCWSMWSYHWLRGGLTEGLRWTRAALDAEGPLPMLQRARLLAADAFLSTWRRDYDRAGAELLEALETGKREGDDDIVLVAGVLLLIVFVGLGDETRARAYAAESLRLARERHDAWAEVEVNNALGWLNAAVGRFAGEERVYEDTLTAAREIGDQLNIAMATDNLAELRMWQERDAEAGLLLAESATVLGELRMAYVGCGTLHSIAVLASRHGQWATAARLQAAADAAMHGMNAEFWPPWLPRRERVLADAREHLGGAAYGDAYASGSELTFVDAATYAATAATAIAEPVGSG